MRPILATALLLLTATGAWELVRLVVQMDLDTGEIKPME